MRNQQYTFSCQWCSWARSYRDRH